MIKKNKEQKYCTLYVARHGETEWNREHRFQGQQDSPLTRQGLQQAKELAVLLQEKNFDAIFSSDLLRAQKTAEIVALEHKLAVKTTNILREQSYGILEGKSIADAREELRDIFDEYDRISDEEKYRYKFVSDMESDEMIVSRFITFIREAAVAYMGKTILVVCHGSIMSAFLVHIGFGKQDKVRIANTGYFKLFSDGVDFFVKEKVGITLKG